MDSLLHGLTWFHRRSSKLSSETTRFAFGLVAYYSFRMKTVESFKSKHFSN